MPPHNLDAEAAVLSAALLDASGAKLDEVRGILRSDSFFSRANGLIFEALCVLADRGDEIDVVTVLQLLHDQQRDQQVGGAPYLAQILDATPAVANVQEHARIMREHHRVRQAVALSQRIAAEGYTSVGADAAGVQKWLEGCEAAIADLVHVHEERLLVPMPLVMDETAAMLDAIKSGGAAGVPTGFTEVDTQTSGLHDGDFYLIAARPGVGKSAYALSMAHRIAAAGYGVPFFSIEMPRVQLGARLVAMDARVDLKRMREQSFPPAERLKADASMRLLRDLPLFIDDSAVLTPLDIKARVKRLQREIAGGKHPRVTKGRIGAVFIDYLQLMRPARESHSREQEVASIGRELKIMAKVLGVPVVALCQLNREVEKRQEKRPQLSDLRECVTGDTLVVLSNGLRAPIGTLVGTRPSVWAYENGKLGVAAAEKVWRVGTRPTLAITLASGRGLRCTAQHRLLTGRGWLMAQQLQPGDRVALARKIPAPKRAAKIKRSRLALLAHLIGDGSYLQKQSVRYTTASEENSRIVERAARELGARARRYPYRQGKWWQLTLSDASNRWHYGPLRAWLRELGVLGQRSKDKRVPGLIFGCGNRDVAFFLGHLWATDGTIALRRSGKGPINISFSTSSRALAGDVAALLLRLGIVARMSVVKSDGCFMVRVSGAASQAAFLRLVPAIGPRRAQARCARKLLSGVRANTNVDTLPIETWERVRAQMREQGITGRKMTELRGTAYGGDSHFRFAPSRAVLSEYAELLNDQRLRDEAASCLFWDSVATISPAGREAVYDITVPGPASWLADGIVSHNSGALEQEADAIFFIYRPAYYDRGKNPDPALKGWAEIIVAKQRNGPVGTRRVAFREDCTRFDNLQPGDVGVYDDGDAEVRRDWHSDSDFDGGFE